jgi:hypothetical protein
MSLIPFPRLRGKVARSAGRGRASPRLRGEVSASYADGGGVTPA